MGHEVSLKIINLNQIQIDTKSARTYEMQIKNDFGFEFEIVDKIENFDVAIATAWWTIYAMNGSQIPVVYFVQDIESRFMPSGSYAALAESTYRQNLNVITIGKWLSSEMTRLENNSRFTRFGIDSAIYTTKNQIQSYDTKKILILDQPEKPRRCHELIDALVKKINKEKINVEIYTYGSIVPTKLKNTRSLGLLTEHDLNDIYAKFDLGIALSSTNPSRIPFEMFGNGLPTIDLDLDSTSQDYTDTLIKKSTPASSALFESTLDMLNLSTEERKLYGAAGEKYKLQNTTTLESQDFLDAIIEFQKNPTFVKENFSHTFEIDSKRRSMIKKTIPVPVKMLIKRMM